MKPTAYVFTVEDRFFCRTYIIDVEGNTLFHLDSSAWRFARGDMAGHVKRWEKNGYAVYWGVEGDEAFQKAREAWEKGRAAHHGGEVSHQSREQARGAR